MREATSCTKAFVVSRLRCPTTKDGTSSYRHRLRRTSKHCHFVAVTRFDVALFLSDEAPNLIDSNRLQGRFRIFASIKSAQRSPARTRELIIVFLSSPVMRSVLRMEFPSSRSWSARVTLPSAKYPPRRRSCCSVNVILQPTQRNLESPLRCLPKRCARPPHSLQFSVLISVVMFIKYSERLLFVNQFVRP